MKFSPIKNSIESDQTSSIKNVFGLRISFLFFVVMLLASCRHKENNQAQPVDSQIIDESLIKANKALVEAEKEEIEQYEKRHGLELTTSPTGLRYKISGQASGEKIKSGNSVELKYDISLLNGNYCYSSDSSGTMKFVVEKSDALNGIHEAVQLMHKGEKAILILPSYLAYGLSGDNDKVPLASALVCNIEVIDVKK